MHAWMHVLLTVIREAEILFQDWLTIGVQRFLERRNSDFTGEVGGAKREKYDECVHRLNIAREELDRYRGIGTLTAYNYQRGSWS